MSIFDTRASDIILTDGSSVNTANGIGSNGSQNVILLNPVKSVPITDTIALTAVAGAASSVSVSPWFRQKTKPVGRTLIYKFTGKTETSADVVLIEYSFDGITVHSSESLSFTTANDATLKELTPSAIASKAPYVRFTYTKNAASAATFFGWWVGEGAEARNYYE